MFAESTKSNWDPGSPVGFGLMVLVSRKGRPHQQVASQIGISLGSLSFGPSCQKTRPEVLISTFQTAEALKKSLKSLKSPQILMFFGLIGSPLEGWRTLETIRGDQRRPIPSETSYIASSRHSNDLHVIQHLHDFSIFVWCHSSDFPMAWLGWDFQVNKIRLGAPLATKNREISLRLVLLTWFFFHRGKKRDDMEKSEADAGLRAPNGLVGRSSYSIWPCTHITHISHFGKILDPLFNAPKKYLSLGHICSPNQSVVILGFVSPLILLSAKLQAFSQSICDGICHILHNLHPSGDWFGTIYDLPKIVSLEAAIMRQSWYPGNVGDSTAGSKLEDCKFDQLPIAADNGRITVDCQLTNLSIHEYPVSPDFFLARARHSSQRRGNLCAAISLLNQYHCHRSDLRGPISARKKKKRNCHERPCESQVSSPHRWWCFVN